MVDIFKLTLQKYNEFQGGGAQMVVFWLSVLLLFADSRYRKNHQVVGLLRYILLFIVVFFCPISAGIIMKYCIGDLVYWRMLWLLPEVIVIAYIFTQLTINAHGIRKYFTVIGCVAVVLITGTGFYQIVRPAKGTNAANLPDATIDICEFLIQSREQFGDDEIRVIVPDELISSIRQYNATIKMPYGRDVLKGDRTHPIRDVLAQSPLQCELLAYTAAQYGCNYFVYPISEDGVVEKELEEAGFEYLSQMRGYTVFRMVDESKGWSMMSYPDASGQQGMFYVLYNQEENSLIVVDGGWKENAGQVRQVIASYGGHVNAWFITHFDSDHVDAFNEIYADPQGITVDKIYITPLDYQYYMSTLREWDTPASYQTFIQLTQGNQSVVELKRDDTFDICGLQIKVFNAYDDVVRNINQTVDDLPNIASLVFKVDSGEKSVLFCGDCHTEEMADMLLQKYGDELQADIVQLGHHGNNSFPTYFYDKVSPSEVLFNAPDWLMTGEQYNAKQLKEYFVNQNVNIWEYAQGTYFRSLE